MPTNIYDILEDDQSQQGQSPEPGAESQAPIDIYSLMETSSEPVGDVGGKTDTNTPVNIYSLTQEPEAPLAPPAEETTQESVEPEPSFEAEHPTLWAAGKAIADIPRGLDELKDKVISGATMGLSEKVGAFGELLAEKVTGVKLDKKEEKEKVLRPWVETAGEMIGSAVPIGAISKTVAAPIIKKIAGSKSINAFHKIIGGAATGMTYTTAEKMISEGELPSPGEVAESGALWGALDGVLHTAGLSARFATAIKDLAKINGTTKKEALKLILKDAKELDAPILKYAEEVVGYQKGLQGIEGGIEIDSKFLATGKRKAEDFVTSVEYKLNKTGNMYGGLKEQLKGEQKAALELQAKAEAEKIGRPLLKPGEQKAKTSAKDKIKTTIREPVEPIPYKKPVEKLRPEQKGVLQQRHNMLKDTLKLPPVKTGSDYVKSKAPRTVAQILKDANTAIGKRGAIGNQKLTLNQIEATQRIVQDAKLAGKTVSKYMEKAGAKPDVIAKILANQKLLKQEIKTGKVTDTVFKRIAKPIRDTSKEVRSVVKEGTEEIDKYLGAVSTRLGNIDPSLSGMAKTFEHEIGRNIIKDSDKVLPLIKLIKKNIKGEDKNALALARSNSDTQTINKIAAKYNIKDPFKAVRPVLDNLHKRAKAVGIDVGYLKDMHPRGVKDPKGLIKHMQGTPEWSAIDALIKDTEKAVGRPLEKTEMAEIIDTYLHSKMFEPRYKDGGFILAKPGALKERKIHKLTKEMQRFYLEPDEALMRYIVNVNTEIAKKKYFGYLKKDAAVEYTPSLLSKKILELKGSKKITAQDEMLIKEMVGARMDEKGTRGIVGLAKNLMLMDTLGSPKQTITQLGDVAWALFTSPTKTVPAFAKAVIRKSDVTLKDAAVVRIAAEFEGASKSAKAVEKLFKVTGLEGIDFIGKETLINTSIKKAQSIIKKGAPKKLEKLRNELTPIFGKETDALINDLKIGKKTDNVRLYSSIKLSGFQPISLFEMPQKYLTAGNGRIFYTLKSFTLKSFDVYRREAFQKMAKKGTRIEGFANLLKLTTSLVMAGAGADAIKKVLFNEKFELADLVIENLYKIVQLSKFTRWKAKTEGIGSALSRQILPPVKALDAISKDISTRGDNNGIETVRSIPYGEVYYSWLGKGTHKKTARVGTPAKRKKRSRKKKKSTSLKNFSFDF